MKEKKERNFHPYLSYLLSVYISLFGKDKLQNIKRKIFILPTSISKSNV
jgi:hypothetical protein